MEKLNEEEWPEESATDRDTTITDLIKAKKVKPGLYLIFEVQEGKEQTQPVDEAIDRTDIENVEVESGQPEQNEPELDTDQSNTEQPGNSDLSQTLD